MAPSYWAKGNIATITILGSLETLVVILRLWSRRLRKVKLAFNDYAVILALVTHDLAVVIRQQV